MNMLAVGVEGDIGADEHSGAAAGGAAAGGAADTDIPFSVSIEAGTICVLVLRWCWLG